MTDATRVDASRFLQVYVVAILLLPSAYTAGSLAVTTWMTLGIVAGLIWVNGAAHGAPTALLATPAGWGLVAFTLVALLGYVVTMATPSGPSVDSAADRRIVLLVCAVAGAVLTHDGLRSPAALGRLQRALAYGGGALALIGILQYVTRVDLAPLLRIPGFSASGAVGTIFSREGLTRVAGTARHPIEFGLTCAVLLPIAAHVANWAPTRGKRELGALSAVLLVAALPMALSRASLLALLAVLIAMLTLATKRQREAMLVVGFAVLVGLILVAPTIIQGSRDLFTTGLAAASTRSRLQAGQDAYAQFAEAPIFGEGLGSLQGLIVDNQYLVTLGELGVAGLVGLLALIAGALASTVMARRATDDPELRHLAGALGASFVGLAVGSAGLTVLVQGMMPALVLLLVGLTGATLTVARLQAGEPTTVADPLVPSDGGAGTAAREEVAVGGR